jgi:hypothetical protein
MPFARLDLAFEVAMLATRCGTHTGKVFAASLKSRITTR